MRDPEESRPERQEESTAATQPAASRARSGDAPGELAILDPRRYERVSEVARGGLGRILAVRDRRLGRMVALKELVVGDEADGRRFAREALLTARLEHPAIVPVHDAGRWPTGEPFYAMKLVSGRSLQEIIDGARTLDERLALLPSVIAVADAIAYAHSHGVIHRDLKPANVLVGSFGETVVIDWGLAKDLRGEMAPGPGPGGPEPRGEESLTVDGAVMGTPHYMPPEQACGKPVDERADVYALGAMLYHVLAGEPPYRGRTGAAVLDAVLEGPPVPLERRQPGVPRDLAAIVRKAMARSAEDRYRSARELVEDLRRFETGRLVSARHYSRPALALRWLQRNRLAVGVAALALAAVATLGTLRVRRVVAERNLARRQASELLLGQARGALERDPTEALAWLRTYPDDGERWDEVRALAIEAESRGVARHVLPRAGFFTFTADGRHWVGAPDGHDLELRALDTGALARRLPGAGRLRSIVASPDGRHLVTLGWNRERVTLIELASATARELEGPGRIITAVAVAPDGRWVASGDAEGNVVLTPLAGGRARTLHATEGRIFHLAFSRDARRLLVVSPRRPVALWELDGKRHWSLAGPTDIVSVSLSRDGDEVVSAHRDGSVILWRPGLGDRRLLGQHPGGATSVSHAPDDRAVASCGVDGVVRLWSLPRGEERALVGHRDAAVALGFSPDGRLLASAAEDGEIRLWDLARGDGWTLGRTPERVDELAFSPDGRYVASLTASLAARLWRVSGGQGRALRGHRGDVYQVVFSPDGRLLGTASQDRTARLWSTVSGEALPLSAHADIVLRVAFSPSGAAFASATYGGEVRLWHLGPCPGPPRALPCLDPGSTLPGPTGAVWALAFSPDGSKLAAAGHDAMVHLWGVGSGQELGLRGPASTLLTLAFSPDGRELAAAGEDRRLWRWQLDSGAARALAGHADTLRSLAYSPDGRLLATAGADGAVRLWPSAEGPPRLLVSYGALVRHVTFSPNGRLLAAAGDDHVVRLWDLRPPAGSNTDTGTGAEHRLAGHTSGIHQAAFSPDGRWLATAGQDRSVRLWEVSSGRAAGGVEALFWHEGEVLGLAFSPDGRQLATAGVGGTVRLWPLPLGARPPNEPASLRRWMEDLSTAHLDAQQRVLSPGP